MKAQLLFLVLFATRILLADAPAGFEDPALLAKVMQGKIVIEDKVSTSTEFVSVGKAFFKQTSPVVYSQLAVNYPLYPKMFEEIKEGQLLNSNAEKTEFDFKLHMEVSVGPFAYDVYPEGKHLLQLPQDAISEGKVVMKVTNYTEYLKRADQTTRLIPYEGGILVEDTVHVVLQKASSQGNIVKKKLKEFYNKYIDGMRKELKAQP